MTKINNHLLPRLIIRNWENLDAKIYDKESKSEREIYKKDFSTKYYYSLGEADDFLENRISKFETEIAKILIKIKASNESVSLSGKEIEITKLFCYLSACRQHNTSTLINSDESGIYHNNNYLLGIPLIETQEEAVKKTKEILDEFERIQSLPSDAVFKQWCDIGKNTKMNNSYICYGTHISIIKSKSNNILISNICAIIECTLDSDYLYTYVPIAPNFALLLVKSMYFQTMDDFIFTKYRFGKIYGSGTPDSFISEIFYENENVLFNSYYKINVTNTPTAFNSLYYDRAYVKIHVCSEDIFEQFNSIMYEDGDKIIFCKKDDLDKSKRELLSRKISIG